jgi:IS605 OrfB family transposase
LALGVDLGIKNPASTSEGIIYQDKGYLTKKRKLRFLKRKLSSKGTKSARRHLKKIKRKERNTTKNMVHNLSKKILTDTKANIIVLENLEKIKENTKQNGRRFNNKHSQISYYMIKQFLTYKAPLYGKRVETVSPAYTSQIDSRTGKKDGSRQRGRYVGKDGKVLHADVNASVNIARRSKHPVSCTPSAIFGQGLVKSPIVYQSKKLNHSCFSITSPPL